MQTALLAALSLALAGCGGRVLPEEKASTCGRLGEACCQVATPSDGPWLWACVEGVQGIIDQADDAATSCGCESACDGAGRPICFPPEPRGFVGQ